MQDTECQTHVGWPRPEWQAACSEILTAGTRFAIDAIGNARVFVHHATGMLELSRHAARRIINVMPNYIRNLIGLGPAQ